MNADEAFDNLMNQNAFPIPKGRRDGQARAGDQRREDAQTDRREAAVRVDELFEDEPGDYRPRMSNTGRAEKSISTRPTEADLLPVDGTDVDDVHAAEDHGARIVGADVREAAELDEDDPDNFYETGDYSVDDDDGGRAVGSSFIPGQGLGKAHRVPRFSYLPLAGFEGFDAEARELGARVMGAAPDRPSLAVTSAVRGEGRTELSIRLALAMAKKVGSRILLADFDVTHPQVALRLGASTKYFTLRDVLNGACPLADALIVGEEDNLYILPSRVTDRDGDEIIEESQIAKLVKEMHSLFDFAVIDCGPVGQVDALAVCRHAGATAVAGMCGVSRAGRMNAAAKRLEASGSRVMGMVLTGGPA